MKLNQLIRGKCFPFSHLKRINWRFVLFVALLLSMTIVGTAYAAASFGSYTGPEWLLTGYRFTVDIIGPMSGNDHTVNISYTVNGVVPAACVNCACTSTGCSSTTGQGTWVCTITYTAPQMNNATIAWDMSTYPTTANCNNKATQGPFGSFTTGPTSLQLTSFTVASASQPASSNASLLLIASGVLILLLPVVWRYKARMVE
jgi:hypothetical protein